MVIDNTFSPSFLTFGLIVAAVCWLIILGHIVLFRGDGTPRWRNPSKDEDR